MREDGIEDAGSRSEASRTVRQQHRRGTGYRLFFGKKTEESRLLYVVSICVPIVHVIFVNVECPHFFEETG